MAAATLGPVLYATIATGQPDDSIRAYCEHLGQRTHSLNTVSDAQADGWGIPGLAGCSNTWLANELDEPWLQILGVPGMEANEPFRHYGWMSLEINVLNTDALFPRLRDSAFEVIGPPANLEVSDAIRAMQAVGPAGEVLYLTEVKAEVPPFELPFARCAVDRLFIPVMLTGDREATVEPYERLANRASLRFETKITVINRAHGLTITTQHPVATLQLAGNHLIEIDQLDGLVDAPELGSLPPGIAWIAFAVEELPAGTESHIIDQGPWSGRSAAFLRGAAGELYELILIPSLEPKQEINP